MPSTARLALPKPDGTLELANIDVAIAALADALDASIAFVKQRGGRVTGMTDASGDLTINHGLGVIPTSVIVSSGINAGGHIVAAHTFTAATFKVRDRVSTTGAVVASTAGVVVDWIASV